MYYYTSQYRSNETTCNSIRHKKTTSNAGQVKVIHIHHDLRNMFITLVWNDQQSFYLHNFCIIILPVLFGVCQISITD